MKILVLIPVAAIFVGFQYNKSDFKPSEHTTVKVNEIHPGKKLMETHCYVCHGPTAGPDQGRIAPPMVAIKAHYIDKEGLNKEEFIKSVTAFVADPTEDKALLKGAVNKHGLMPKQIFPDGVVEKIADFMFDYQIEEPAWFKDHWESHGNKKWTQSGKKYVEKEKEKSYEDLGLEYALSTKNTLGKNLMGAIQKKGTLEALTFCNQQAMHLTDSMSTHHKAKIRRVSDKNRNPKNKANKEQLHYIAEFKKQIALKEEPKPVALDKGKKIQFYYPITTNSMCLQCHGKTDDIKPEVRAKILKLYPNDLAVGYGENEVRGIWSITFDKK